MLDPVITPSGNSYERKVIEQYLNTKSEDPLSRAPLTKAGLIPNLALRSLIATWLIDNPWAHPRLPLDALGKVNASAAGQSSKN